MQVPFPHVLSTPPLRNNILRVVTDEEISVGKLIADYDHREHNKETQQMEQVFNVFVFDEIEEERPARGDWKNWASHPNYFRGTGRHLGFMFESQIQKTNNL